MISTLACTVISTLACKGSSSRVLALCSQLTRWSMAGQHSCVVCLLVHMTAHLIASLGKATRAVGWRSLCMDIALGTGCRGHCARCTRFTRCRQRANQHVLLSTVRRAWHALCGVMTGSVVQSQAADSDHSGRGMHTSASARQKKVR